MLPLEELLTEEIGRWTMSTQEVLVVIDAILPNPWQPREHEDPEHIKSLALSIAAEGLLQVPVGRRAGDKVELAFGHSRLAAYKWIRDVQPTSNIPGDWTSMPVIVREISDEEMFRLAISENVQRRDLTPIEEARAMKRYRDEFGKTSAEIGVLFGMAESTVRNKMRLIELPAEAQTALEDGKITENGARRLLSVQKILSPAQLGELATQIAEGDYSKPEQVDNTIRYAVNQALTTVQLFTAWSNKDLANGLWPMDWNSSELRYPEITFGQFKKCYSGPEEVTIKYPSIQPGVPDRNSTCQLKDIYEYACIYLGDEINKRDTATVIQRVVDAVPEAFEVVSHLYSPPACKQCPFFVIVSAEGFCGRKTCFERKKSVWIEQELARVSDELGVQIYEPAVDGKHVEEYQSWGTQGEWFKKALEEKSPHLRVRAKSSYYNGTGSSVVQLIGIEPKRIKLLEQLAENDKNAEAQQALRKAQREQIERQRQESCVYLAETAAQPFGDYLYGTWSIGAMELMRRVKNINAPDKTLKPDAYKRALRQLLGYDLVWQLVPWEVMEQGVDATHTYLVGVAKEIGMSHAALTQQSVSVETVEVEG